MGEQKTSAPSAGEAGEVVVKKARISMVWIVPLVVVVLAATIIYKTVRDAGVPITLTFENAEGLEAGKTKIRYKDVDIGLVDEIRISDDATHVILDATIDRHAEKYLVKTTRFWVVRPRVTLQGVTGLGTLLSGAYINADPGAGEPKREFTGLEVPPILALDSDVRQFILHADDLGSVTVGSPIIYRGLQVGEVISYRMMEDDQGVEVKFYVRDPHHNRVFTDSKFWDVSGLNVEAGADGVDVKIASIESLMIGGIAFETSPRITRRTPAAENAAFRLHRRHSDIDFFGGFKRQVRFYFEDSLRGLAVGAPVEYRGIKVGEVTDIVAEFDSETNTISLPVTAVVEPERVAELGVEIETDEGAVAARMARFVELGMRAQLKTGSLLSGALFVDLVMQPDAPVRLVGGPDADIPEIPTIRSSAEQLMTSARNIVAKLDQFMTRLDKIEIERLVSSAAGAVEGFEKLVESEDVTAALKTTNDLLAALQPVVKELGKLISNVDTELAETGDDLAEILRQAETTFANLNHLLEADSPTQAEMRFMLKEIAGTARSLRTLTDYLERHPEALIRGKAGD